MDGRYRYNVFCCECGDCGTVETNEKIVESSERGFPVIRKVNGWDVINGRWWVCPKCAGRAEPADD